MADGVMMRRRPRNRVLKSRASFLAREKWIKKPIHYYTTALLIHLFFTGYEPGFEALTYIFLPLSRESGGWQLGPAYPTKSRIKSRNAK